MTNTPWQTDEVLHEQKEWLRVTLSSIGDGVITCDNSGMVTFLNPVAQALTGWTQDEAAGVPLETVFRIVNEESRRTVENPAARALREGSVVGLANHTLLINKDGTERPIDDSAAPIRSKTGEVVGCVLIFRDVTERRRAVEALWRNEEQMRVAVATAKLGQWSLDLRTLVMTCSDGCKANYGRRPDESFTYEDLWVMVHPDDRDRVQDAVRRAIETRTDYDTEYRTIWQDGTLHWVLVRGRATYEADGTPVVMNGVTLDITDRRRSEEKLRASETRFRFLDALSEVTRDAADPAAVMKAAARLLGEHLDVTRCAYADVEPDNDRFTIRDDWTAAGASTTAGTYSLDLFGPRAAADMRTGRNLVVRDVDAELTGRGGAEMFNAIGIKAIICCPLVKDGRLRAMMAVHHAAPRDWADDEVTLVQEVAERSWAHIERVRSAAALRNSEERFRMLFDSMDEGFCVIEMIFDAAGRATDYRFLEANPAFENQSKLKNAVGRTLREIIPDQDPHWFETYGQIVKTGEPVRFERFGKALGDRWFNIYAFRLGGPGSNKVAVLFNDITDRKRAEQEQERLVGELQEQDRRKDEFLAMLSHELRNPLAPISNAVQLLRLQSNEDPLQQQARIIIERQVGQLKRLIDDLLEVSRITTGRVQLRQERIAVGGIVERAVETTRPLMSGRRHELTVTVPPQPIWLYADAARLEQVLVNLLTNAAKYTDEGGHIQLTIEQAGDEAVLRVRDTGVGIAPELLPHIFDLFTQAERSLARSEGGLGIGLALVQRLVELHGGHVEVHSMLGQGSEFVVRLPLWKDEGGRMKDEPAGSALDSSFILPPSSFRVLVVDDHVDSAESLLLLLSMSGYEVRMVHDGPAAVEAALEFRPDVVLLDIGLPQMDGYEVARKLRQQPVLKNAVLVALTGYGQESDRQLTQEAGFDHHLVKPADFEKVRQIVATVMEKGQRRKLYEG